MSVGIGKTYLGLSHMEQELFKNVNSKFLVVAPKLSIFQTWKDECIKHKKEHLIPYITFSTYRSLSKADWRYTCVYLDEVHNFLFSHRDWIDSYRGKILGLTGTLPVRRDTEKYIMIDKYCPPVYRYTTDEAIEDEILNDYKIYVHPLSLNKIKNIPQITKTKGTFYTSELKIYEFWSRRIDSMEPCSRAAMLAIIMRMKALMDFKSKENYAKQLITKITGKCLVFANTTEQAERICQYTYHNKNSKDPTILEKFKSGDIMLLAAVLQLSEGINIPNLKYGVILHSYGNVFKLQQRIGRLVRLNPTETAIVHILMYKDTIDEKWVRQALGKYDQSKITYL
jgi:superfamily II DNA or RNA helicase